ncbi:BQ5605_C001g00520 [Microbotryum silenes-dioicae]|uniref:BQ5605_C001g00520 protein n=1 Tax=Microbotryum silenes-dioicae TaxID=796604 RepID=A0A2X0M3L3_9BASI|nr:BQ5605_C001g00520 [Microbotryum silenes-dioicae]
MAPTYGADRFQREIKLKTRSKGCHLVTNEIMAQIEEGVKNTKCDPDVRTDMDMCLDKIVPESLPWDHVDEGPDDSVSHSKSSLIGASVQIPIMNGRLALGTWQGIYLLEFRKLPHSRRIVATVL